MNINKNKVYLGYPILKIREILRKRQDYGYKTIVIIIKTLQCSKEDALRLIRLLLNEGLLEIPGNTHEEYSNTLKGNSLACASAAKPLTRATANKNIAEFLERVREVNTNNHFLFKVIKVEIFGSFLTSKERISDIDLIIYLKKKINDHELYDKAYREKIDQAIANGRSFSNVGDKPCWPEHEVKLFLKSRSRAISLHTDSDGITELVADSKKTIYELNEV